MILIKMLVCLQVVWASLNQKNKPKTQKKYKDTNKWASYEINTWNKLQYDRYI